MRSVRYSKETLGVSLSMICAATVFVKQHSILDVFAALALSLVLYLIIYVAARRIVDRRQPTATA